MTTLNTIMLGILNIAMFILVMILIIGLVDMVFKVNKKK